MVTDPLLLDQSAACSLQAAVYVLSVAPAISLDDPPPCKRRSFVEFSFNGITPGGVSRRRRRRRRRRRLRQVSCGRAMSRHSSHRLRHSFRLSRARPRKRRRIPAISGLADRPSYSPSVRLYGSLFRCSSRCCTWRPSKYLLVEVA